MLGKDANRNEYWFFREDPERIYMRAGEESVSWHYLDEEVKFEQLVDSMNPKGIRERKLLEGLKKCKDRLKLKKPKKTASPQTNDVEMTTEGAVEEETKKEEESEQI